MPLLIKFFPRSQCSLVLDLFRENIYHIKVSDIIKKNDSLVARLHSICDRTSAAAIVNCKLYVLRSQLKTIGEGEYYYDDLRGCNVYDVNGYLVGIVSSVHNFGAGDFLDIGLDSKFSNKKKSGTIGFNKDSIIDVNLEEKKIIVDRRFLLL